MFENREEAGRKLGLDLLKKFFNKGNTVILAIPRGGVPVAYEMSKILKIPFSLIITKKLAPLKDPEAAFGAIAPDKSKIIDENYMKYMGVSETELNLIEEKALRDIQERMVKYLKSKEPQLDGKDVIIVDDGIATGYTAIVAGIYAKNKGAKNVYLAVPVCPSDSISRVLKYFSDIFCLKKVDTLFFAVGSYYKDFHQISDEEMFSIIEKAKEEGLLYS